MQRAGNAHVLRVRLERHDASTVALEHQDRLGFDVRAHLEREHGVPRSSRSQMVLELGEHALHGLLLERSLDKNVLKPTPRRSCTYDIAHVIVLDTHEGHQSGGYWVHAYPQDLRRRGPLRGAGERVPSRAASSRSDQGDQGSTLPGTVRVDSIELVRRAPILLRRIIVRLRGTAVSGRTRSSVSIELHRV